MTEEKKTVWQVVGHHSISVHHQPSPPHQQSSHLPGLQFREGHSSQNRLEM
eukprot:CAMPEP_0173442608 /NCGR_PEP_ID=MMETSP1357-20121228/27568_1 /TAXON_ID=77926 /ORGANISM="Hemiselmis rufescens, Strain PCC563" /LENGTH=50 /DNA_ID=CAMNT_0014408387 /DNA_START=90 /DNA_END=239 /DNA_ORIENTATION=-